MLKRADRQKEIRNTIKRNKRRRTLTICIISFLILGIAASSGFFFVRAYKNGVFDLKNVKVIGNEITNEQNVIAAGKFPMGKPVFLIDYNQIRSNIEQSLITENLSISISFPDTLIVKIKERPAMCAVINQDSIYYFDQNRRIIGNMDYIGKPNIPIISGFKGIEDQSVGTVVSFEPAFLFDDAVKIMKLLNGNNYLKKISEIVATPDHYLKIISKNNCFFIVSGYDLFEKNYDFIGTLLEENYNGLEINFVTGDYPILKER